MLFCVAEVKRDSLDDEPSSYADRLIFCLVFVLEENLICFWKELLIHSRMCLGVIRSPAVREGFLVLRWFLGAILKDHIFGLVVFFFLI